MKTALIEVQDKFKSTLRFYEVKHSTTVVIDPCQVFDDSGYAVLLKSLEDAVSYVRHRLIASYIDGLIDPQEKADTMKSIHEFYRVIM